MYLNLSRLSRTSTAIGAAIFDIIGALFLFILAFLFDLVFLALMGVAFLFFAAGQIVTFIKALKFGNAHVFRFKANQDIAEDKVKTFNVLNILIGVFTLAGILFLAIGIIMLILM